MSLKRRERCGGKENANDIAIKLQHLKKENVEEIARIRSHLEVVIRKYLRTALPEFVREKQKLGQEGKNNEVKLVISIQCPRTIEGNGKDNESSELIQPTNSISFNFTTFSSTLVCIPKLVCWCPFGYL